MSSPVTETESSAAADGGERRSLAPPAPDAPVILAAKGIVKDYQLKGDKIRVLHGIDMDIRQGEAVAIVGPSGAGKTTFLQILGSIDSATSGQILYRDRDVTKMSGSERARYRNSKLGFVFQFYHLFKDLNALENVLLPSQISNGLFGWFGARRAKLERARELLERVGLTDRERHRPNQLSGGERQRVAIARALMERPEMLLCDEPTGNLDTKTGDQILDLLFDLREDMVRTFVIVTHDAKLAGQVGRQVNIVDGRVESDTGRPS